MLTPKCKPMLNIRYTHDEKKEEFIYSKLNLQRADAYSFPAIQTY